MRSLGSCLSWQFQSTPSARRATWRMRLWTSAARYFNPRPPRGGRPPLPAASPQPARHFNPRPPRGGRHSIISISSVGLIFQSTPSARRATLYEPDGFTEYVISIHALREEGDQALARDLRRFDDFNPRPPRGGRPEGLVYDMFDHKFQSTPSARRATAPGQQSRRFYYISIHALREEGDEWYKSKGGKEVISIHALREEGDVAFSCASAALSYFNPRPPRGGRPMAYHPLLP